MYSNYINPSNTYDCERLSLNSDTEIDTEDDTEDEQHCITIHIEDDTHEGDIRNKDDTHKDDDIFGQIMKGSGETSDIYNEREYDPNNNLYKDDEYIDDNDIQERLVEDSDGKPMNIFKFNSDSDYDVFFINIYKYYMDNGFNTIIISNIVNLLLVICIGFLSVFITRCVKWIDLYECKNFQESCKHISNYIDFGWIISGVSVLDIFTKIYSVLIIGYIIWYIYTIRHSYNKWLFYKSIYNNYLKINDNELSVMEWGDVVIRIENFVRDMNCELKLIGYDISPEKIIRYRINRYEDIMKQLICNEFLDKYIDVKFPITPQSCIRYYGCLRRCWKQCICCCAKTCDSTPAEFDETLVDKRIPENEEEHIFHDGWLFLKFRFPLTDTIIHHLRIAVIDNVLDENCFFNRRFTQNDIRFNFIFQGILHLLFLPFIIVFISVYWSLSIAEEGRSTKNIGGNRRWSIESYWRFRNFNEYRDEYNKRMIFGLQRVQEYLNMFINPFMNIIMKLTIFITGSFAILLVGISLIIDEQFLTDSYLWDKPLYWYLAILSAIVAGSRGLMNEQKEYMREEYVKIIDDISSHTGMDTSHLKENEHTHLSKKYVQKHITNRLLYIVNEIISLVIAPVILIFYLPIYSGDIVKTIYSNTRYELNLGIVAK